MSVFRNPQHIVYLAQDVVYHEQYEKHENPKVQELVDVMRDKSDNIDLRYAWEKYQHDKSRMILNGFLLADATYDIIRQTTHVPMHIIQTYQNYLFDTSVFRDKLDRIAYVDQIQAHVSPMEHQYLAAALTSGEGYFSWMLNDCPKKMPTEVLHHYMMDGYFRSLEHRNTPIDSPHAQAALNWIKQGLKAATELHRMDPQDEAQAMDELRLALAFEDTTINKETQGAPRPEDILH